MGKLCPHVEFHPGIVSLSLSLHSSFFLPELSIFLSSAFLLSLALPFLKRLEICRRMGEFDSNEIDDCRPMRSLFSPWVKRNEKERKER